MLPDNIPVNDRSPTGRWSRKIIMGMKNSSPNGIVAFMMQDTMHSSCAYGDAGKKTYCSASRIKVLHTIVHSTQYFDNGNS